MRPTDSARDGMLKLLLLQLNTGLGVISVRLAPPVLRLALALPFLRSGLTRWDGFLSVSVATQYLFEEQFKLHILGAVYDLPTPDTLALLVAIAEILLPALLLLGLATRLAALGLLLMTAVIQLVFPDGWMNFHLYWAALALAILALGPGRLSIDYWLGIWLRPGYR
ncbi:MAG: DoxX family membrane protein [Pseudomonas sp.]